MAALANARQPRRRRSTSWRCASELENFFRRDDEHFTAERDLFARRALPARWSPTAGPTGSTPPTASASTGLAATCTPTGCGAGSARGCSTAWRLAAREIARREQPTEPAAHATAPGPTSTETPSGRSLRVTGYEVVRSFYDMRRDLVPADRRGAAPRRDRGAADVARSRRTCAQLWRRRRRGVPGPLGRLPATEAAFQRLAGRGRLRPIAARRGLGRRPDRGCLGQRHLPQGERGVRRVSTAGWRASSCGVRGGVAAWARRSWRAP